MFLVICSKCNNDSGFKSQNLTSPLAASRSVRCLLSGSNSSSVVRSTRNYIIHRFCSIRSCSLPERWSHPTTIGFSREQDISHWLLNKCLIPLFGSEYSGYSNNGLITLNNINFAVNKNQPSFYRLGSLVELDDDDQYLLNRAWKMSLLFHLPITTRCVVSLNRRRELPINATLSSGAGRAKEKSTKGEH